MPDSGALCNVAPGRTWVRCRPHPQHIVGLVWRPDAIVGACAEGLTVVERDLAAEHAPYGLDALAETDVHPKLADSLLSAGFGVYREWPFPGAAGSRAEHRERERCDLVLTSDPNAPPDDPVNELRAADRAVGTLFEPLSDTISKDIRTSSPRTPPDECLWIEIKVVGQFTYTEGVPGPNRSYASELTRGPAADIRKLSKEQAIAHAAAIVVLFTADDPTAQHDLGTLLHKCLDRNLPVGAPSIEGFAIADRVGNARCSICLIPVKSAQE